MKSRLKNIKRAVLIWTLTRLLRALIQYFFADLFYGYIFVAKEVKKKGNSNLYIPMLTILVFIVVDIWPMWHVLDGSFVDILLTKKELMYYKDITEPMLP